ncbi:MAG: LptF/LptG family permease [Campylobacterales bacterium]|nr:LptF/LptG family permease [Campylobacterales bacterium]
MVKLRRYIFSHLNVLFFSIFIPLFTIASVIFMIKLATYTAIIQLNIDEMGKLYLFVLPELLFYTLPIAFVVASVLTLYRLSNDNEMVVVFSLGISPVFLVRILALPAFLLTILLFVDYLIVTPYVNSISKNFLSQKKAEAKFNLTASEFGHNFGDWMLFINKSDNNTRSYGDVVLFNKDLKEEVLLVAHTAELLNAHGNLQLRLSDGEGYSYQDQGFKWMNYKHLLINDIIKGEATYYKNTLQYWTASPEKQEFYTRLLITNALLSLLPVLSLFLIVGLGVVHARHQKRLIYLWLFVAIIIFYSLAIIIQQWLGFHAIWAVSVLWLVATYFIYKRLVGNRF